MPLRSWLCHVGGRVGRPREGVDGVGRERSEPTGAGVAFGRIRNRLVDVGVGDGLGEDGGRCHQTNAMDKTTTIAAARR